MTAKVSMYWLSKNKRKPYVQYTGYFSVVYVFGK